MLLLLMLAGCGSTEELYQGNNSGYAEVAMQEQWEKGYNLPVDETEEKEAEKDCIRMMELYCGIYESAAKGSAANVVLEDEAIWEIQNAIKESGAAVAAVTPYSAMENYETVDTYLDECTKGQQGFVVYYEVRSDGGLNRMKFIFNGTDMYVVSARGSWKSDNSPALSYVSYTRLLEWKYTSKGWFGYKLCVPSPEEVGEVTDGSCLIRVKPMTKQQQELSQRCIYGLGYQGNNLLCSNWDVQHLSELDYNGLFEYLYKMKYGTEINSEAYSDGIPKAEFEKLIMEYIPVTAAQLQAYAAFDEDRQVYLWERLWCFNYAPTYFGTSLPEVVNVTEKADGVVTLTVEAVCDMVMCDDAVITHELTVQFEKDGSFRYLGNTILNDGINNIPEYQYRIRGE